MPSNLRSRKGKCRTLALLCPAGEEGLRASTQDAPLPLHLNVSRRNGEGDLSNYFSCRPFHQPHLLVKRILAGMRASEQHEPIPKGLAMAVHVALDLQRQSTGLGFRVTLIMIVTTIVGSICYYCLAFFVISVTGPFTACCCCCCSCCDHC